MIPTRDLARGGLGLIITRPATPTVITPLRFEAGPPPRFVPTPDPTLGLEAAEADAIATAIEMAGSTSGTCTLPGDTTPTKWEITPTSLRTDDGFSLRLDVAAGTWTDGDMDFDLDGRGCPISDPAAPLPNFRSHSA